MCTVAVCSMGVVLREDERGARLRESLGLQQRRLPEVLDIRHKVRVFAGVLVAYDSIALRTTRNFHDKLEDTPRERLVAPQRQVETCRQI